MPSRRRVAATVKIKLEAGQASPGKVGQALGVHGVNISAVIAAYNTASAARRGRLGSPAVGEGEQPVHQRVGAAGTAGQFASLDHPPGGTAAPFPATPPDNDRKIDRGNVATGA